MLLSYYHRGGATACCREDPTTRVSAYHIVRLFQKRNHAFKLQWFLSTTTALLVGHHEIQSIAYINSSALDIFPSHLQGQFIFPFAEARSTMKELEDDQVELG